jgi:RNA-directed DNA polymerase
MTEPIERLDSVAEPRKGRHPSAWGQIDWQQAEDEVRRLQERIFRAAKEHQHARVRNLQRLVVRSYFAKALAIRQVTQINSGKGTPGVDGCVCKTDAQRMGFLKSGLSLEGYRPSPVRRVYIPKADGKRRPLGIPTVKDRVMQALVKLALEPEWESRFEANSYGFRPGRSTHDAIKAIWLGSNQTGSSQWVVDADISGCFDNIDHDALLALVPEHFHEVIRRWLKAGVVELGKHDDSLAGTPQGGVISPLLANIALDGIERLFEGEKKTGQPKLPSKKTGMNRGIQLIRYADDFVVFCPSREVAEQYVRPELERFLATRGLRLSDAKTKIAHIDDGFDFLGFSIRHQSGKVIIKPQKEKVRKHVRAISEYLRTHRQQPTAGVIRDLNPVIRGWANYYRHVVSKRTFAAVDNAMWPMLFKWAKRRHPTKSLYWVKTRYFPNRDLGRSWVLTDGFRKLLKHDFFRIQRWIKVEGRASPSTRNCDPTGHAGRRIIPSDLGLCSKMLEPDVGKPASPVLRGTDYSDVVRLLDHFICPMG